MMIDFVDCAEKCISRPWRFPITGSNEFIMYLTTDTRCRLYGLFTAVCLDMDILTSYCMLLHVFAASSLADDFKMCVQGHKIGGCIGSIPVN
jgi:hypothetical protein